MWAFTYFAFGRILELLLLCLRRRESNEIEILVLRHELDFIGLGATKAEHDQLEDAADREIHERPEHTDLQIEQANDGNSDATDSGLVRERAGQVPRRLLAPHTGAGARVCSIARQFAQKGVPGVRVELRGPSAPSGSRCPIAVVWIAVALAHADTHVAAVLDTRKVMPIPPV